MSNVSRRSTYCALCGLALRVYGPAPLAPAATWTTWSWHPWVLGSLILAAWLYVRGARALGRSTGHRYGTRGRDMAAFWSGWAALVLALLSPLHALGADLFAAPMVQHAVLMLVAAPLPVLSRPLQVFLWALPRPWRRVLGKMPPGLRALWRVLTHPLTAWAVHAVALWIWHIPRLFQATLTSELVHTWQHLSFFGTALCFWWALCYGRQALQGYGVAVLAVFTTALHSSLLGALLTLAPTPWYPAYARTTAAWGLTPLEDQQLGGLIMWIPAGVLYMLAGLAFGAGWLRAAESQSRRRHSLEVS